MICAGFSITCYNKVLNYNDCCNVIDWHHHKEGVCSSCSETLKDLNHIRAKQNEILDRYFPSFRNKKRGRKKKNTFINDICEGTEFYK